MQESQKKYALSELAQMFDGELIGADVEITFVSSLERASSGSISFYTNPKFEELARQCLASALVVKSIQSAFSHPQIVCKDPQLFIARVLRLLNPAQVAKAGIDSRAVVANDALVDVTAEVAALAVVESGAEIGAGTIIMSGVIVERNVKIGANCTIHPRVVIYHDCEIGDRTEIHSGAIIGSDGFGNAWNGSAWEKIPQIGRVLIGSDVEIGANTTIDRGAIDDTVIADGVRLDNLIQIAHNVEIGKHTAIAAATGIAGSAKIGANCLIGGGVLIAGHIEIADKVTLLAGSAVPSTVQESGVYASGVPIVPHGTWLRNMVQFRRLDELAKRVKKIEKQCSVDDTGLQEN